MSNRIECALIMCGGKALRFGGRDKSFVEYKGKPLIEYLLHSLRKAGIKKIIIICNKENYLKVRECTKKIFDKFKIISNPPSRFRGGINISRKYLNRWFLLVAGNQPLESEHIEKMIKIFKKNKSWVVSLYKKKISSEKTLVSISKDFKIKKGRGYVMQHPFILSKDIIKFQKKDAFNIKIEKSIKKRIDKINIYGVLSKAPPEFDNEKMLINTLKYLKQRNIE